MSNQRVGAPSRGEAGAVATAFFLASALGLALLALVARWLTPEENARFLALWGLIFSFGSVFGAVEQEVSRQSAAAELDGHGIPRATLQAIAVTLVGASCALAGLMAVPAGRALTSQSVTIGVLVFVALGGFSVQILSRGAVLGAHSIARYVIVLLGEAVMRVALAAVVIAAGVSPSLELAVVLIVVGCFSWLPVVPWLVRKIDRHSELLPWRRVALTVAALAVANGLSALVLTGYPTLATVVIGHPSALGDLFAVLTVSRVPLVLLAPVQALTVPVVLRWIRDGHRRRLHRVLLQVGAGSVLAALVGLVFGYELGPWLVRLMMGGQYDPAPLVCGVAIAATCLITAALLQAAVLVALERYWLLTGAWLVAVVLAGVAMTALPVGAEARALWGFVVAAVTASATMTSAVNASDEPARQDHR